jgi:hypothetical protein
MKIILKGVPIWKTPWGGAMKKVLILHAYPSISQLLAEDLTADGRRTRGIGQTEKDEQVPAWKGLKKPLIEKEGGS